MSSKINAIIYKSRTDKIIILTLSGNQLNKFSLMDFLELTTLDLSDINIISLSLTNLPKLTTLDLSYINIISLSLTNLPKLTTLDLIYNQLNELSLIDLPKLTTLDLSGNQLHRLSLAGLPKLATLDLQYNQISELSLTGLPKLATLDLSDINVTSLSLTGLPKLATLDLSYINITSLSLTNLPKLTTLDLSNNRLPRLSLAGLPKLATLDLGSNRLFRELSLTNLPELTTLILSNNRLRKFSLTGFLELTTLDLSDNQLTKLSLTNLPELTTLNLSYNQLTNFSFLSKLSKLTTLNLSNNQLTKLSLTNLPELTTLNLSYNQLTNFSLTDLPKLIRLDLSGNQLNNFSFLSRLPKLIRLDLSGNQLRKFSLMDFLELTALDLSDNYLGKLSLRNLPKLIKLDLTYNPLDELSLTDLSNLTTLDLSGKYIRKFSLTNLPELTTLDLSDNQLTKLSLTNLPELTTLNLSYNQLTNFSLTDLPKLIRLDLSGNQLESIPKAILAMQIRMLNFTNNLIETISYQSYISIADNAQTFDTEDIHFLKHNLKKSIAFESGIELSAIEKKLITRNITQNDILFLNDLYLKQVFLGNPLESPPLFVVHQGKYAVLKYYSELNRSKAPNDEIKLILVGNSTAGKSSLSEFLRTQTYNQNICTTHGIHKNLWDTIALKPHESWEAGWKEQYKNATIKVNIWDFGGQEYYHATHRLFLSSGAVYIVLWEKETNHYGFIDTKIQFEGEKSVQIIPLEHFSYEYWKKTIKYYTNENSTLILQVQNKIDLLSETERLHLSSYAISLKKTFEDWNKTSRYVVGYKSFLITLEEEIQKKTGGSPTIKYWLTIRDALYEQVQAGVKIMAYESFVEYCQKEANEPDIEVELLIEYLQNAGVILFYPKNKLLEDKVFIDPNWVCSTIYHILDYTVQKNQGQFTKQHVVTKLENNTFQAEEFINLMTEFELIFQVKEKDLSDTFVAPQYLPNELSQEDQLRLEGMLEETPLQIAFSVHFTFLPRSTMARLIATFGVKAIKNIYWKNGIRFAKEQTGILLQAYYQHEPKIEVSIENTINSNKIKQSILEELVRINDSNEDFIISLTTDRTDGIKYSELFNIPDDVPRIKTINGNWVQIAPFRTFIDKTTTINDISMPTPSIFFSYAWGDPHETGESREKIVDELYDSLRADGYNVMRDKKDIGYKGLISEFMQRIGKGQFVVVVISEKYLKSVYCMNELLLLYRQSNSDVNILTTKIFPIVLPDAKIYDPENRLDYILYWKTKKESLKAKIDAIGVDLAIDVVPDLKVYKEVTDNFGLLSKLLSDMNTLSSIVLADNNFKIIKYAIEARYTLPKVERETDNEIFTEDQMKYLIEEMTKQFTRYSDMLPSKVVEEWKKISVKQSGLTDIRAKFKLTVPIIPHILSYETEIIPDLFSSTVRFWNELKSGQIFITKQPSSES